MYLGEVLLIMETHFHLVIRCFLQFFTSSIATRILADLGLQKLHTPLFLLSKIQFKKVFI